MCEVGKTRCPSPVELRVGSEGSGVGGCRRVVHAYWWRVTRFVVVTDANNRLLTVLTGAGRTRIPPFAYWPLAANCESVNGINSKSMDRISNADAHPPSTNVHSHVADLLDVQDWLQEQKVTSGYTVLSFISILSPLEG